LVETLVAISIFSVSLVGLMTVLGQGIANTGYAKKKAIAAFLAQEGIEYVRNIRDTYMLYGATTSAGWTSFNNKLIGASCQLANGCYFDDSSLNFSSQTQPIVSIPFYACSGSCPIMYYDPTYGRYNYALGSSSEYRRKINITQLNGATEARITSTVYYSQGSGTYSVSFSESLFNWVE